MNKRIFLTVALVALLGLPLFSETLRIGSIAPADSPWETYMMRLSARWAEVSGGRVQLKIYSGGAAGDEPDLLRKMRIGQLQGAALSQLGLSQVSLPIMSLSIPFMIRDQGELDYVLEHLKPQFEKQLLDAGFQPVLWSSAGWIRFFSRDPIVYPKDLMSMKLAVTAGDFELTEAWKKLGVKVIPLSMVDFLTALQTGMVDALYSPPLLVASLQWFGATDHMSGLVVAPVISGMVITKKVWERIPADIRPKLLKEADILAREMNQLQLKLEKDAIEVMQEHGLHMDPLPPAAAKEWQALADEELPKMIGGLFSPEIYKQMQGYLQEYRKNVSRK